MTATVRLRATGVATGLRHRAGAGGVDLDLHAGEVHALVGPQRRGQDHPDAAGARHAAARRGHADGRRRRRTGGPGRRPVGDLAQRRPPHRDTVHLPRAHRARDGALRGPAARPGPRDGSRPRRPTECWPSWRWTTGRTDARAPCRWATASASGWRAPWCTTLRSWCSTSRRTRSTLPGWSGSAGGWPTRRAEAPRCWCPATTSTRWRASRTGSPCCTAAGCSARLDPAGADLERQFFEMVYARSGHARRRSAAHRIAHSIARSRSAA